MLKLIFNKVLIVILKLLFRLKVEGLDNLPKKSNFIIVANHTSLMDPLVMLVAIPKRIYWLALRELSLISWLDWFIQKAKAIPTGGSSEKLIDLLMRNKNVGLFPEGSISRDGKIREFRRGAALLAIKTGRPIVPCAILGTNVALPRKVKLPKFLTPIKVKIGKPRFLLKEFDDIIDDIYLQEGILKIRNAIEELLYV